MKILITISHRGETTTRAIDVSDRAALIYSVAAEVIDFVGKEAAVQHHYEMVHYQLERPDGSVIASGTPRFLADLGIPDGDGVLKIELNITPKKFEKADVAPKETFEMIRTAISRLLETDTEENRKKAKQCIKTAAQMIIPHLPALREYLQKNVKDDKGKHKPIVHVIRSWLNEATPLVELSTEDKKSLIQELHKEKPNVASIKKTLHGVTSLSLYDCKIDVPGAQALAAALKNNTTLISLDLGGNYIGDSGAKDFAEVLESNTTLTSLNLAYNRIEAPGAKALAEALKSNTTLTSLCLSNNQIGDLSAKAFAEALKSNATLTSLYLGDTQIGELGATDLAKALESNATLTSLELWSNQIREPGAKAFAKALKRNITLSSLNLRSNQIGDSGAIGFAKALKKNATLTSLSLEDNQIIGVTALAEALKSNATLTFLNLQENHIEDPGAIALAEALKSNATLISLNLLSNQIRDSGAVALAEALASNATLTFLDLRGNYKIEDPGVTALAEALKSNFSLIFLSLSPIDTDQTIDDDLQRNKNRLAKATEYLRTFFVKDVTPEINLIPPLTEIIGDYLIPNDLTSECDITGSAARMSQFGLHAESSNLLGQRKRDARMSQFELHAESSNLLGKRDEKIQHMHPQPNRSK